MPENIKQVKTYDGELHDLEVDLTNYYNKSETDTLLNGKVDNSTLDAYYTTSETDSLLNAKADKDTTYTKSQTDSLLNDKADKANTYTDVQVNALLANKADSANVYTKADTDTLLATKANADSVYTKAEADVLLNSKANSADVYTKTEVYTKSEVDTALGGKADTGVSYTKAEDDALLGAKANSADVYTITQTDALLESKASVDDSSTTSTVATWSADKLHTEFQNSAKLDSANVFEGGNTLKDHYTVIKMSNLDITDDTISPVDGNAGIPIVDKNDVPLAYINIWQRTIGNETRCDLAIGTEFGTTNPNGRVLINGHEVIGALDTSNVIHNFTGSETYTCTSNGWLIINSYCDSGSSNRHLKINNVTVFTEEINSWNSTAIVVSKGDIITTSSMYGASKITLYGFK